MSRRSLPTDIQKSDTSIFLNSTILGIFLMGMYTMIYTGTLHLYFTKNPSNRRLVPATITILFLTVVLQTGIQWYEIKFQFIDQGDTLHTVFLALFNTPVWATMSDNIFSDLSLVIADGLLIWRCYFVWNRSIRIISVPLLLIITEAGLFFTDIVLRATLSNSTISPTQAISINDVLAAGFFISSATSLVTTILIAYRIYAVFTQEGSSATRFRHILDVVVQSGVVYSLTLLLAAISEVAPGTGDASKTHIIAFQSYVLSAVGPIAGISATIVVARVAMLASDATFPSSSVHLSGLQFHVRSTDHKDALDEMESRHSTSFDTRSAGEEQEIKGKIQ